MEEINITGLLSSMIPHGKENAITRASLKTKLGVGDRTMRRAIEAARKDGLLIVNDGDGAGYYQVSDDDLPHLSRQYWQDTARISAISKRRKHMKKILKDSGWAV